MPNPRKYFISVLTLLFSLFINTAFTNEPPALLKPTALQVGDTVGLIASSSPVDNRLMIQFATQRLQALGLKVKYGKYLFEHDGYLAGTDKQRAADVNAMFADSEVKAIFEIRGGWGCNLILPFLDYQMIQQHPKIIMGYSDITSLLLAIYAKTGLITFHGPMPFQAWPNVTANYVTDILFTGKALTFSNPAPNPPDDDLIQTTNSIYTINGGKATGKLLGGSLTIITSMLGSPYQPDYHGAILFVEDINESPYRIDRMLTQLENAGILKQISGFIFGQCVDCGHGVAASYGSLTLQDILDKHIKPLHIPAWSGAMFGHQTNMFILPEGVPVTIDADKGSIQMLNPAVVPVSSKDNEINS